MTRPSYLHSCAGCSAHLVSQVRPPEVNGFGQGRYCEKCKAKNAATAEAWGSFQKGDRVKFRNGSFVWSSAEELTVTEVNDDMVTLFRLGFGTEHTVTVPAAKLTFKYTYGRN